MIKQHQCLALLTAVLIVASPMSRAQSPNRPAIEDVLAQHLGTHPFSVAGHEGSGAPALGNAKTVGVLVDCDAGDSIGAALLVPADELIVKIHGICREDVEIRRDKVTLAGRDPALDGIQGTETADVVTVREAANVTIENLQVLGTFGRFLVDQSSSDVRVANSDLGITSVAVTQSSDVAMEDVTARFVLAELGGRVYIRHSNLQAVSALDGGLIALADSAVNAFVPSYWGAAIGAWRGTVVAHSTRFDGWVEARGSTLALIDSSVTHGVTLANTHLELEGHIDFAGYETMYVEAFSSVWIEPGSSIVGDIVCGTAGNVSCDDVMIDGTVQGCALCNPAELQAP